MLLLAFVAVVTRHMAFNEVGRDAVVVPDELVRQSGAGKAGFRLGKDRLLRPSVQGDEKRSPRKCNLDRAYASDIPPLVDADIFRQDFGSDLYLRFLGVRDFADPVLLPAVGILIANRFEHF